MKMRIGCLVALLLGALGCGVNEEGSTAMSRATRVVTYRDVKPILDANCKICHGRAAGLNLEQFPFTSKRLGSQKAIVEAMLERTGNDRKPMPPAPRKRLSAGERQRIADWLSGGLAR